MNKKIFMTIGMVFLVLSLVVVVDAVNDKIKKSAQLKSEEITKLKDILPDGYWDNSTIGNETWVALSQDINPQISSCIAIDEFKCRAKIYQMNLVNKDLTVTTKYCETFEDEELGGVETPNCLSWVTLSKAEIEAELETQAESLLKNIAKVKKDRDDKVKTSLTDEIDLVVTT